MPDKYGSTNYPGAPGAPAPMIDATTIQSAEIDPSLSQAILSKVASGATLLPAEKLAASKLPPGIITRAALSGTAPLPPGYTPPDPVGMGTGPGGTVPKTTVGGGEGTGTDVMGGKFPSKAMGNSFENQGLLPSGNYAGAAEYQGSTIVDPLKPKPLGAVAPPVTPPAATAQPAIATPSPTAQVAAAIVSDPAIAPKLKGLDAKGIAMMIGNILDAVGVGLSARGGVNRETMLQKQMGLQQESAAKQAQAQAQATIDIDKEVKLAPVEIQKSIALARASGDIGTENAIRLKNAIAPIDLADAKQLAAYTANLDVESKKKLFAMGIPVPGMNLPMGLFTNPAQAGANYGANIAGVGIK